MGKIIDITNYGAVCDKKTINTKAIQKAIDACQKGDTVYVPSGRFVCGALFLKSDMTLEIEKGGILFGSDDLEEYPIIKYRFEGVEQDCYASLINTQNGETKNITICGGGTIDGNGSVLAPLECKEKKGERGRSICFRNVETLILRDITVMNAPAWCCHLIYCKNITIDHIRVQTKCDEDGNVYGLPNGDGIDIDSCRNVKITNCMIESEDDCIAIKSGRDEDGRRVGIASENIEISNCNLKSGFGVAIGSEMSGGVKNVNVSDCTFEDTFSIATVKAPRGRGAVIENITYNNCKMLNKKNEFRDCKWFRGALYVDQFYSHDEFDLNEKQDINEGTPKIKNITFSNIDLETIGGNAVYLAGLRESPLENITLKNVSAKGVYGLKAYNIDGLKMENVSVTAAIGDEEEMINVKQEIQKGDNL